MRGRQKIEAALSQAGTAQVPAVICYGGIFVRDHWRQVTSYPWWYQQTPNLEHQMLWRRAMASEIDQDWLEVPLLFLSRAEREHLTIEERSGRVFRVNRRIGDEQELIEPPVGGKHISVRPRHSPSTPAEIDKAIPLNSHAERYDEDVTEAGRGDLAMRLLDEFGEDLFPVRNVSSPLECCFFDLWGFEEAMINIVTRPDLVKYACRRFLMRSISQVRLAAQLGIAGIFIEDCLTDMINPKAFASLNVPYARSLVDEIHQLGLHSVYYFCGNPAGKWDLLMSIGADALSLEESKKGFTIDIEDVVERVNGRCTVLGNLDAVGILQNGSEEQLRAEIARQIAAGRRNGSRFIMSIGSPVTPETSAERVRLYCDLTHELGRG